MRDKQVAHAQPCTQVCEQAQDEGLDGHVQCRGRLVEDQQRRLDRDRARDADARSLSSRELMRVAHDQFVRQTDQLGGMTHAAV
jgi:hypothetical protein